MRDIAIVVTTLLIIGATVVGYWVGQGEFKMQGYQVPVFFFFCSILLVNLGSLLEET